MRKHGLRGRSSPMNDATDKQKTAILELAEKVEAEGHGIFAVRYSTWIGHGCAADKGGITVEVDGRIYAHVYPDGYVGL
jgi:hypothetical protein